MFAQSVYSIEIDKMSKVKHGQKNDLYYAKCSI